MTPSIEIKFRNVPREILIEFENKIDKSISLEVHEDTNDHLDPPAEIVIYLNEPLTEIMVSSTDRSTNTFWDGLNSLWKKIKRENNIELNFGFKPDTTIEFDLNGNIDPNQIDGITEDILRYLKNTDQQKKDFANPDFKQQQDDKPRLRVRYNPITDQLELVNFTAVRKQIEEAFRRLAGRLKG